MKKLEITCKTCIHSWSKSCIKCDNYDNWEYAATIREKAEKYFEDEINGEPLYQDSVIDWLTDFATKLISERTTKKE